MSETKTAGVVTRLFEATSVLFDEATRRTGRTWAVVCRDAARALGTAENTREAFPALDLVASWPPELREVVALIEALTPEGKALLPDVLRGLSVKGMPALLEAQVGAVSTSARVAAWFGGLGEDDLLVVKNALLRPGTDEDSQWAQELGHELRSLLDGGDLDLGAERLADQRMPRRQPKGTCPTPEVGQLREGPADIVGRSRVTHVFEEFGERWTRTESVATGRQDVYPVAFVEEWPLAADFDPSDLAGLANREELQQPPPLVWKAGTVPPAPRLGMVFLHPGTGQRLQVTGVDLAGQMHLELPGGSGAGWWRMSEDWKLAEDFPIPEDFAC